MINHELQSEWKTLTSIKQIIFNLNNENITQSFNSLIDIIDYDYIYSFNLIVCQMAYEFLIINIKYFDAYLSLIIKIEKWEEKYGGPNIFTICKQFLLNKNTKESYYFLEKMIERNFCGLETKQIQTNPYFVHYMSEIEMQRLSNNVYMKKIIENYEKLSKNNWELHKQLIEEGNNPNEISKIIRNDEIEKLQEISLQNNFDFNQTIEPSLYERCSFIQYNVTLIDYAAFFSSVKCFKYLLMNNAKVNNTGKYAIAGGNEEIIHLCEQNHSTFKSAYETAIMFHRNDIFKYIYENKLDKSTNLEELGKKCVLHHNYEVLSFLLKEGIEINDKIINETARIGNIFLIQDFIQENSIPNVLLLFVAESGNIELFKYIKENKEIDINTKNERGETALMIASLYGHIDLVEYLLKQERIDINSKNNNEDTALILASTNGYSQIVNLLIEHKGININAKNKDENTALILASTNGYTKIVKLLLEQEGINVNIKNKDGDTALILASMYGYTEIVKLLLEHKGIDINAHNKLPGDTALMKACFNGNIEIVKLLLSQKHIDINVKDKYGETAAILAKKNNKTEIIQLLNQERSYFNVEEFVSLYNLKKKWK